MMDNVRRHSRSFEDLQQQPLVAMFDGSRPDVLVDEVENMEQQDASRRIVVDPDLPGVEVMMQASTASP